MLTIVDPYGSGQTTFTEVVNMLEIEKLEVNDVRISIMEYCAMEKNYDF